MRRKSRDQRVIEIGRDRRIRIPAAHVVQMFQLTLELGFKSDGKTIKRIVKHFEDSIIRENSAGTVPAITRGM